jgi:Fe-S cluster assembly ATP-binding protein
VSILVDGRIVQEGGPELVEEIETQGYAKIRERVAAGQA